MKNLIFYLLLICLSSCKNANSSNLSDEIIEPIKKVINDDNLDCVTKTDKEKVKKAIIGIINNINNDNEESLASMFDYPISMFNFNFENQKDFIKEWNKNNQLKNYLSLEIYDENDEYIGKTDISTVKIIYTDKVKNNCLDVQVGVGYGLILKLDKVSEKIKIIKIDVAG